MVKLKHVATDKLLGRKLWNTSLLLTGMERQFAMYGEDEGATSAENEAQVISTAGGAGGGSTATTSPEKRAASAAQPTAASAAATTAPAAAQQS